MIKNYDLFFYSLIIFQVRAYNINLTNGSQRLSSDVKLAKLESINNGDQQKKSKFSFKPEHLNVNYFFR